MNKLNKDRLPMHRTTRAYNGNQRVALHVDQGGVLTISDFINDKHMQVKLTESQLRDLADDLKRVADMMICLI